MWLTPDRATLYALDVLDGLEVAGPHVRAACRRHMADRKRTDIWFDDAAADRACRFFEEQLRLGGGQFQGKPFLLHASQAFKIASIFGWKRPDGRRRFMRAYIEEGKGNGKTPLSAGIGLFGLIADFEPGAQIYSAATTKDQADIMFQDAVAMAKANEAFWGMIKPKGRDHVTNMAILDGVQAGAFFRPVSRNVGRSGSGPRPHFVMADELHEHPNRAVLAMLEAGFKFRRQPLLVMTTNSGSDRKSVCWEERENAVAAAAGDPERDDTFAYVCALDEEDDPLTDPDCWRKANPLLGTILTEEYLTKAVSQARTIPGRRNGILRLHFCVWTDAETAWLPREIWEEIEDTTLDRADFAGRRCRIGLDLSSRKDIAAVADVYEDGERIDEETGKMMPCFAAFVHGFTPGSTLVERAKIDKADYENWVADGYLTATPGSFVKFEYIVKHIAEIQQRADLEAVAYDRWMITRFEEIMAEEGCSFPLVEHPQGWNRRKDTPLWMPGSVEIFEELVMQKRLRVVLDPVLRAAVAGATFLVSSGNLRRFDKQMATQRIDLVVAITQAIGAWHMEQEPETSSVYEELAKRSAAERRQQMRVAMQASTHEPETVEMPSPSAPKSAKAGRQAEQLVAVPAIARFSAFLNKVAEDNRRRAAEKMRLAFGDVEDEDD